MSEVLAFSIGLGLVIGLMFTEFFGIASGGLVVPGYIALFLTRPLQIVVTVGIAFAAFSIVKVLSMFLIVYGRRRTALMILIGYLLGMLVNEHYMEFTGITEPVKVIGFIIPGLIAVWMERQGVFQTIASMITVAIIVRLVLILMGVEVDITP